MYLFLPTDTSNSRQPPLPGTASSNDMRPSFLTSGINASSNLLPLPRPRIRIFSSIMKTRRDSQATAARPSAEMCAVCLERILGKKTLKCSHSLCSDCIESPACRVCITFYGEHTGNQPVGTMTVTRSWQRLPGYERCGSIVIQYKFLAGIQGVSLSLSHTHPRTLVIEVGSFAAVDS